MIEGTLEQKSAWLAKRKKQLGLGGMDYVPVNPGTRRTPGKRLLLAKLAEVGRKSRRALRFTAKF